MSCDRPIRPLSRHLLRALAVAGLMALGACTVQPLYGLSTPAGATTPSMQAKLASVAISPVSTRDAQIVRNRLIFLLAGGAGSPADPKYRVELTVSKQSIGVGYTPQPQFLSDQVSGERIEMIGSYKLTDAEGNVLATGKRQAVASIDLPDQGFAARSARSNGAVRAGEDLAEMLRLAIAQDLMRH